MPINVQYNTVLIWRGDTWFNQRLIPALEDGIKDAVEIYAREVHKRYKLKTGSVTTSNPSIRLRVAHSSAGEAPYRQTFNLSKSVRKTFSFALKTRGSVTTLKGRVSTDVPYAPPLEFGGIAIPFPQRIKKYTTIRLANPIRKPIFIAPRPVWIPAFNLKSDSMLNAIVRKMRNV